MKKLILTTAILVGSTGFAIADIGAGLIGNTVTLTGPDGAATQIYYPDASSTVVKTADGAEINGSWRVEGNTICSITGDTPETCTPPIEEAPAVGSTGSLEGDGGTVNWAVTAGKGF